MVIKNFLFHRVSDEVDSLWPPMKPALFARIIEYLARHYQVVPLEHYLNDPGAFTHRKKLVTVLFDDGYKDNIEFAAPILQQYNCPASFYVVTDCIDKNIPTWTYLIDNAFQQTHKELVELNMAFVPEHLKEVYLKEGNGRNAKQVKPWMKSLPNAHRLKVVNEILLQCDDVPMPYNKMMNWSDVKQLSNDGFIIGSHSHTHPMLASLADRAEIAEELSISFQKVNTAINIQPLSISYPIGSFDERVIAIAKEKGYTYGLAVEQRFYDNAKEDLFAIPRVELYQEPWWKIRARISGVYNNLKRIWN